MDAGVEGVSLAVLGAGYVGLVTAACLSTLGSTVTCIDRDEARIEALRRGVLPFYEPGLEEAVGEGVANGRLNFASTLAAAQSAAAIFICVGTLDRDGEWSSHDVNRAVGTVAADAAAPRIIVIRSTLSPGSTKSLMKLLETRGADVEIALNPEFTRQGSAVNDFLNPDRIVIGLTVASAESRALPLLRRVYERVAAKTVVTDAQSAEMIKIGSNVFLALKAGYANELARLSAATGADVSDVIEGIGLDPRIGTRYMTPGPGLGGSCLPAQSRELPSLARELSVNVPIMASVDPSNAAQASWVVDTLEREVGDLAMKRICVLGLTFKAGTDDVRESPALRVCRALAGRNALLRAHDPMGAAAAAAALAGAGIEIETCATVDEAARNCDAVVVTTEWPEYREIDWHAVAGEMRGCVVLDTRYVIDAAQAAAAGMKLTVLGRSAPSAG